MKNQLWPSLLLGVMIAAFVVIAPGLALAGFVAHSVTLVNGDIPIDRWQAAYSTAIGWSAAVTALMTGIWLHSAHRGDGLDTKTGPWWALGAVALFTGVLLPWIIPPATKEGLGLAMCVSGLLVLAGYWLATLFMTPDHYAHTPLLGRALLGGRR